MDQINNKTNYAITGFLRRLLDLMNQHTKNSQMREQYKKDLAMMEKFSDATQSVTWLQVDMKLAKELTRKMEEAGIPHIQFDEKNTNNCYIVFSSENRDKVQAMDKSIRLYAGLEIDSPEELEYVIQMKGNETMFQADNIHPLVAYRVMEMAKGSNIEHKNMTIVSSNYTVGEQISKEVDFKQPVSLYCEGSKSGDLRKLIISATVDLYSPNKNSKSIRETMEYYANEKLELSCVLNEIDETGSTAPARVYSLSDPNTYLRIDPSGYAVVRNGVEVKTLNQSQMPGLYTEMLSMEIKSFQHPIYKTAEEVSMYQDGGDLETIHNIIRSGGIMDNIGIKETYAGKAMKEWIAAQYTDPVTGRLNLPDHPDKIGNLSVDRFIGALRKTHEGAANGVEQNKVAYQKQIDQVMDAITCSNRAEIAYEQTIDALTGKDEYVKSEKEIKTKLETQINGSVETRETKPRKQEEMER